MKEFFTAADIMRISGATYRQIDYWCNCGDLGEQYRNLGVGNFRQFTVAAMLTFYYAVPLIRNGFDRAVAINIARHLVTDGSYSLYDSHAFTCQIVARPPVLPGEATP